MQDTLQITMRDMAHSEELDQRIRDRYDKLRRRSPQVMACRVVIEAPHKHHAQGRHFSVKLDITAPGHEIVVTHRHDENAYVALREAFRAAQVQLDAHAGEQTQHGERTRGVLAGSAKGEA